MELATVEIASDLGRRKFHFRPNSTDEVMITSIFRDREYDLSRLRRGTEIAKLYRRLLETGKSPLIVDAGANIGAAALWFTTTFSKAVVVAIEPEMENFEVLRINSAGASIEPIHAALSSQLGQASVVDPGLGACGFRTSPTSAENSTLQTVETVTVGQIYERMTTCTPFIVKIDIEGGEGDVFTENTGWLEKTPVVIIELHDWLLPRQGNARAFLQCVSALDRDFVYLGENVYSIDNNLSRFGSD